MNNTNCNCECCSCSYIPEIICRILELQGQDYNNDLGCDRPFLGPNNNNTSYNTRPIQLYNSYTAQPWSFNYTTSAGATAASNTFRVENMEQCSVTVRILAGDGTTDSPYTNTNQFATINLCSVGAIRCFADQYIAL